eukprot:1114152-Amphidinium_carterae.1
MLTRGNLPFTRVMVVHVDHLAARKQPSLTRDALSRISTLNIVYQIDVMGGDFNASIYRYFSGNSRQRSPSLADSSLRSVLMSMRTVVNDELQTQCGGPERSWMGGVFQYQLICANTKDLIEKYGEAVKETMADMKAQRDAGDTSVPAHQTRLLQDAVEDFGCDAMAVVVFSWAHTSVEGKAFQPTKPQHLKGWKPGQEYFIHVQGYHLELTATILGLRPRDKDFHTLLNIVINDWSSHYKRHFMTDMEKMQNEKHTNAEWKQMRLEKEQRLGYNRRKHAQRDTTRFEEHLLYEQQRPAKSRGRGTGWQERQPHWSSSSSSSWQWSSD